MERLFQILAVILAGVAAFFLWRGNWDATFVSAVFGAVCFFLSVRFQVRDRMNAREAEREREELATQDTGSLEEENEITDAHEINTRFKQDEQDRQDNLKL